MSNLSPQAQEVFWAFNRAASGTPDDWHYLPAIAAAVRAVADQVAPEDYQYSIDINSDEDGGWVNGLESRNQEIRDELLAIAAELEAQ